MKKIFVPTVLIILSLLLTGCVQKPLNSVNEKPETSEKIAEFEKQLEEVKESNEELQKNLSKTEDESTEPEGELIALSCGYYKSNKHVYVV